MRFWTSVQPTQPQTIALRLVANVHLSPPYSLTVLFCIIKMSRFATRILSFSASSSSHLSYTRSIATATGKPNTLVFSGTRTTRTITPSSNRRSLSLFSLFQKKTSNTTGVSQETSTTASHSTSTSSSLSSSSSKVDKVKMAHHKSDDEWRAILTPEQFRVLRQKGTERAYTGQYTDNKEAGVYTCAGCNTPLYTSTTKFDACGWCSFYDAIPGKNGCTPNCRSWSNAKAFSSCSTKILTRLLCDLTNKY